LEKATNPPVDENVHQRSPQDSKAAGRALRDRVPRAAHAGLTRAERDPLGILRAADANRLPELVPIRYGRMLASPFAFFRGSAGVMAADLAHTPSTGISVQACGDCHLKNFGGFATPERNIIFDINDFDETLPAPWEWDVKRLATSFVLATRENGLSERAARDVAITCARAYRNGIHEFSNLDPLTVWYAKVAAADFIGLVSRSTGIRVARRIAKAAAGRASEIDYPKLAETVGGEIRIHDSPPLIFHPEVGRTPEFASGVEKILSEYRETLPHDRRVLLDRYTFVDAAIKVVGVGSVGTRCWIALLMSSTNEPLFLQLKQANASVLEPYAGRSEYSHHGQRVVVGQRLMQAASDIFLGWTTGPAGDFYVRQLRDAKIGAKIETFDEAMFTAYARACGWNLARAHAKSGDAAAVSGYLGKKDSFDTAIAAFAKAYSDLAERDHAGLKAAVKSGRLEAYSEL
jgi:uncharacterized protein (DUF2252 family)